MSCGVGHRHGSDPASKWLWRRPEVAAQIGPLAWQILYAAGVDLKRKEKKNERVRDLGICQQLHLEWISNEVVLYSTGK